MQTSKSDTNRRMRHLIGRILFVVTAMSIAIMVVLILTSTLGGVAGLGGHADTDIPLNFAVHYADVGQGDAVIIILPNKQTIIIDSGSSKSADTLTAYIAGIRLVDGTHISGFDYAILTHPDEDHAGGFDKVLARYHTKHFFRPNVLAIDNNNTGYHDPASPIMGSGTHAKSTVSYRRAIDAIYSYSDKVSININTPYVVSGMGEGLEFEMCIYPFGETSFAQSMDNDYSPVITLNVSGRRFLFSGDAGGKVVDAFVNNQLSQGKDIGVDVLMLGHHGSATYDTNSAKFLSSVIAADNARYVIIIVSCGADNSYGHPSPVVLGRLDDIGVDSDNILRTDTLGNIIVGLSDVHGSLSPHVDGRTIAQMRDIYVYCSVALVVIYATTTLVLVVVYYIKIRDNR